MRGFFELKAASDLYAKLKKDFSIFEKDRLDSSAAFNFFVTAWHLLEWTYPGDTGKQKLIRDANICLQICEHLAVGAKHFHPTAKKHKSVQDSDLSGGMWAKGYWAKGVWAKGYWGEKLVISLDGDAASKYGSSIYAYDLAKEVMDFWKLNEKDIT